MLPDAVAPPRALAEASRWLLWRYESGEKKPRKVPYYIDGTPRRGDLSADGHRLVIYSHACAAVGLLGGGYGIGFALGDGWQGVDLDHLSEHPELVPLVDQLPGYVEVSPSGDGVHAIGYGRAFQVIKQAEVGIEAYCAGRFFTFTGRAIRHVAPVDLAACVEGVLRPRLPASAPVVPRPPIDVAVPMDARLRDELISALQFLPADCDYEEWTAVGHCLKGLGDAGREIWFAWSRTVPHIEAELEPRWARLKGDRTGFQSIFNKAAARGWKNPRKLDPAAIFAGSEYGAPAAIVDSPTSIDPGNSHAVAPDRAATGAPSIPPMPTSMPAPVARIDGQSFRGTDGQLRAATLENVVDTLMAAVRIGYDAFQDLIMIERGGTWHPITDNDYGKLRAQLGRGGFKPVAAEIMRTAVGMVAEQNNFDSAIDWARGLQWDGVARIDTAMPRYYGTVDTPYSRAVGAYLFTALAGRALVPGCQADMAVILIGLQGAGKTSAVSALAPQPRAFGTVDLSRRDDDLSRKLRGKLVVEWAELRGLSGRDQDGIKAWLTNREEEWTPKYKEFVTTFRRRCIVIGTGNDAQVLDDPTGERRALPITAGITDVVGITRDCDQLWAEGVARFLTGGIEWQAAEQLARDEHGNYKVYDDWSALIYRWLDERPIPKFGEVPSPYKNGERPFSLLQVAAEAIGLRTIDLDVGNQRRIGKLLRHMQFESKDTKINGRTVKLWHGQQGATIR